MCTSCQGPDPLANDQPVRIFGDELTQEQQRAMVIQGNSSCGGLVYVIKMIVREMTFVHRQRQQFDT